MITREFFGVNRAGKPYGSFQPTFRPSDSAALTVRSPAMQTFIPLQTFAGSANVLDDQRLGKQRIEAAQILGILLGYSYSVADERFVPDDRTSAASHPAVLMWRGSEKGLAKYLEAMCWEWKHRGFHDHVWDRAHSLLGLIDLESYGVPDWLDGDEVCSSHRAVLLGKDRQHYSQFGWKETPAVKDRVTGRWPYVWPVPSTAT
jgi:hypothetical protein